MYLRLLKIIVEQINKTHKLFIVLNGSGVFY